MNGSVPNRMEIEQRSNVHDFFTDILIEEIRSRGFVIQAQQSYDNMLTALEQREETIKELSSEVGALEYALSQAEGHAV